MKKLHDIQLNILRVLLFAVSKRYSEIKPIDMGGSKFKFHMDTLISLNLIKKIDNGQYSLSIAGKELANQMDSIDIKMRKQSKVSAKICCVRTLNDQIEYLLYKRQKNPFYGFQGFPNSKIWYGSSFEEGVRLGLFNETNLVGDPQFFAIRHYMVYTKNQKKLLEDKTMYMYKVINPTGDLKSKKDGIFKWVKESNLENFISRPLPEYHEVMSLLIKKSSLECFKEVMHLIDINDF